MTEADLTPHLVEDEQFFEITNIQQSVEPVGVSKSNEEGITIYGLSMALGQTMFIHHHITYGPADFLSDIGGVAEVLIFLVGFCIYPLSR